MIRFKDLTLAGKLLALGVCFVTVALLVAYVGWRMGAGGRERIARAEGAQTVAEGGQRAAVGAMKETSEAAADARASEDLTRSNRDDILSTPGADASVGSVSDAGLRSLCRRVAYAEHPRCAGLRPADR